jgi:hypothetical protein
MVRYHRFRYVDRVIKMGTIVQTYFIAGTAFAIIYQARSFGNNAPCNALRTFVFFGRFSAVGSGRIIGICLIAFLFLGFSTLLVYDLRSYKNNKSRHHRKRKPRRARQHRSLPSASSSQQVPMHSLLPVSHCNGTLLVASQSSSTLPEAHKEEPDYDHAEIDTSVRRKEVNLDGNVIVRLTFVGIISVLMVVNTELLIHHNHPNYDDIKKWSFGQVSSHNDNRLPISCCITESWLPL